MNKPSSKAMSHCYTHVNVQHHTQWLHSRAIAIHVRLFTSRLHWVNHGLEFGERAFSTRQPCCQ